MMFNRSRTLLSAYPNLEGVYLKDHMLRKRKTPKIMTVSVSGKAVWVEQYSAAVYNNARSVP